MRRLVTVMIAGLASPLAAQTPTAAVDQNPAVERCEALPIGGTGSVTGVNGVLTIAGTERDRVVRLDERPLRRLGRDVASATIRAGCRSGTTDYYLLALAAPASGASCPVRYLALDLVRGRAPRFSQRFGSCADGGTATMRASDFMISMPLVAGTMTPTAYRYQSGQIVPATPPPVFAAVAAPADRRASLHRLATWTAPTACAIVTRKTALPVARTTDIVLADFQRDWPRDWRTRGRIHDQPFGDAALRAVVTDLACLAALPGGEAVVARAARPLFSSGRHGRAAFEQLDEVARGVAVEGSIRAAARQFHAQMRFEVDQEPFWR